MVTTKALICEFVANWSKKLAHIVINNSAHETVGGMPIVAKQIDFVKIAEGCRYPNAVCASEFNAFDFALKVARRELHSQLWGGG